VPLAAYFHPKNMTLEQFNEVHRRLEAAGWGEPKGRLHHSCFGEDGSLMVFEVWDKQESFDAFGAALMPILGEVGIDPGQPAVMPVHRINQTQQ
jgi:hypothetical protein